MNKIIMYFYTVSFFKMFGAFGALEILLVSVNKLHVTIQAFVRLEFFIALFATVIFSDEWINST